MIRYGCLIGMFLMITIFAADSTLTTTSSNYTTMSVGSTVTFSCQTTNPTERVRWLFYHPFNQTTVRIYNGFMIAHQFKEKFVEVFDNVSRQSYFTIKSCDVNDTGTFVCLETNSTNYRINFTLRIIETTALTPTGQWTTISPFTTATRYELISTSPLTQSQGVGVPTDAPLVLGLVVAAIVAASLVIVCFVVLRRRRIATAGLERVSAARHPDVLAVPGSLHNDSIRAANAEDEDERSTLQVPPRIHAALSQSVHSLYANSIDTTATQNDEDEGSQYAEIAPTRNNGRTAARRLQNANNAHAVYAAIDHSLLHLPQE